MSEWAGSTIAIIVNRLQPASINLDWFRLTHRRNVAPGERGAFSLKPTAKSVA